MDSLSNDLREIISDSINRIANRMPGCRLALDCNLDYGTVQIAVNPTPQNLPPESFFTEHAEARYFFADWPIPNLAAEQKDIEKLWTDRWAQHEDAIRDEWIRLPEFDHEFLKKRLLQEMCRIAASISARETRISQPILVANHDEHIRHTTDRLGWAYLGTPSDAHQHLADAYWSCVKDGYTHRLSFFHDGEFINHIHPTSDPENAFTGDGDWCLEKGRLSLTLTETNIEELNESLWKPHQYEVEILNDRKLVYREGDGTLFRYARGVAPAAPLNT